MDSVILSPADVYDMLEKLMDIRVEYIGEGNLKWRAVTHIKGYVGGGRDTWDNVRNDDDVVLSPADVEEINRYVGGIHAMLIGEVIIKKKVTDILRMYLGGGINASAGAEKVD